MSEKLRAGIECPVEKRKANEKIDIHMSQWWIGRWMVKKVYQFFGMHVILWQISGSLRECDVIKAHQSGSIPLNPDLVRIMLPKPGMKQF